MDHEHERNIISMTEHRTDIGFSPLSQVESYWEALRGTRMMPKRSEIDPRGIEAALEYTFVLERIAPGMARLRIAGSHLSDLMGMEVRGMPLTSFITPNGRRQISDTLEEVFQRPAVCEVRLSAETGTGKPHMDARMLLLPLKSDLGDVSRVLGCLIARGELGRSPRRFDVVGANIRPILTPATAPQPTLEDTLQVRTKVQGTKDTSAPSKPAKENGTFPYLRLVTNDD